MFFAAPMNLHHCFFFDFNLFIFSHREVAESKNENDDAEEIKSSDNPDAGSEQVETAKVNDDEEKPKSVEEGSASPESNDLEFFLCILQMTTKYNEN